MKITKTSFTYENRVQSKLFYKVYLSLDNNQLIKSLRSIATPIYIKT